MKRNEKFINIEEYLEHWNKFFIEWINDPKKTFENDEIWKSHKGIGKFKLEYDVFPQPFLGNFKYNSVISLNLNPSRSKKNEENKKFEETHLKEFKEKFKNDYHKYAKSFPTYEIKFWQNQLKWIDRLFNHIGVIKTNKRPLAIEICPWGSQSWGTLEINDKIIDYMDQYVFNVIEKAIKYSDLKIVLTIGKAYYDIFENEKSDFKLLEEISNLNNTPKDWPRKKSNNALVKRSFSIWIHNKSGIKYLNVGSPKGGGNAPPATYFDEIISRLIKKHVKLKIF